MPYNGLLLKLEIKCLDCKRVIIREHSNTKRCPECAKKRTQLLKTQYKRKHYKQTHKKIICVICSSIFDTVNSKNKFCSKECRKKQHRVYKLQKLIDKYQREINLLTGYNYV